jgi:ABC-type transport system involved in multi-copper enzyme maturation permease subunit
MSLRDLGYRPYEGERLAPSHIVWVLWRYGLSRAWASWLVKLSTFFGWVPAAIGLVIVGIYFWMQNQGQMVDPNDVHPEEWVARLLGFQLWLFVTLVSLGAGASAIAEDFTHRAFQFYFAKPVTPLQYLLGRTLAVGLFVFALCFIPALLLVGGLTGAAPAELRLEWAALVFPALAQSLVVAVTIATASVGVSSLSTSRALTMSAWILLLLVPHVVASVVEVVGDFPWLRLASLPAMLSVTCDSLFRVARHHDPIAWYHAALALSLWVGGAMALSFRRLRKAEVIT